MEVSPHQPAGFCPYCDYATDPGKCTECGREVTADRLAQSPRIQRFKRLARRAFIVTILIGIFGGVGYGLYRETRPNRRVRYYSTDYLLSEVLSPWDEPTSLELRRRCRAQQLSSAQLTLMIEKYGTDPTVVSIQPNQPVNAMLELCGILPVCGYEIIGCGISAPYPYSYYKASHEYKISVDDETKFVVSRTDYPHDELRDVIRQLPPGIYKVGIHRTTTFGIQSPTFYKLKNHPIPTVIPDKLVTETFKKITISEKTTDQFSTAIFDKELFFNKLREIWFNNDGRFKCSRPTFSYGLPAMAGTLHFVPDGMSIGDSGTCAVRIPHDEERLGELVEPCIKHGQALEAVFIPCPTLAHDAGYQSYFNGLIRWEKIEFDDCTPLFGKPDEVIRYSPSVPDLD